jgi:hypothetical protein
MSIVGMPFDVTFKPLFENRGRSVAFAVRFAYSLILLKIGQCGGATEPDFLCGCWSLNRGE